MSNSLHQKKQELRQRLAALGTSESLMIVKEYLALNYESYKDKLVENNDDVLRGRAKECKELIKDFTFE